MFLHIFVARGVTGTMLLLGSDWQDATTGGVTGTTPLRGRDWYHAAAGASLVPCRGGAIGAMPPRGM